MPTPVGPKELKPVIYQEIFPGVFFSAILKMFSKEIQSNYFVADTVRMSDGKWLIKLERTLSSYGNKELQEGLSSE